MRSLGLLALSLALIAIAGIVVNWEKSPGRGPLQPADVVNSFSKWVDDESTMSLVVELRGEQAITATLSGVSLASPDSGLQLVESGILVDGYPGTYTDAQFPLGALKPIAGAQVTTVPGDPSADIFFNLGIRVSFGAADMLSVRGVWLDYSSGGASYRAFLPWLLTVCENPVTGTCEALEPAEFTFPPG